MAYIIRFDVLPSSAAYDQDDRAFVAKSTRPFGQWAVGKHLIGDNGRTLVRPHTKGEAHRFALKKDAADALGVIVANVWSGGMRWIGNPEIVEVDDVAA